MDKPKSTQAIRIPTNSTKPEHNFTDLTTINIESSDQPSWINKAELNKHIPQAKDVLKSFIKATIASEDSNSEYTFILPVSSLPEASDFIHRMRVELSRQRARVLKQGRTLKPFGVKTHYIKQVEKSLPKIEFEIKLSTRSLKEKNFDELADLVDEFCVEEKVNRHEK